MAIKKYYAVAVGRRPGIYTQWFGQTGAQAQVIGFQGARYKGFASIEEARAFVHEGSAQTHGAGKKRPRRPRPGTPEVAGLSDRRFVYTDGSSLGNPGPGGYGVVIPSADGDLEWSGGFRKTTNNRMELLACIVGLEQFDRPTAITLFSDSRYVVDGVTKGWAQKWRRNGWRKGTGDKALNIDLWRRLLELCDRHDVRFTWVRGHAGNPGNERCDRLATQAANRADLPVDTGYEMACPSSAAKSD